MSAERKPHRERAWLERPLVAITRTVLRVPRLVILLSLVIAVAAAVTAQQRLGFRTSRLDLLNSDSSYNRRWLAYLDEFGTQDDLVVVVEGASRKAVAPVIDEIAMQLAADPVHFESVFWYRDLTAVRRKALHFLELEQLQRLESWLDELVPLLRGNWDQLNTVQLLAAAVAEHRSLDSPVQPAAHTEPGDSRAAWIAALATSFANRLTDKPAYQSPWEPLAGGLRELDRQFRSEYLLADGGRMGFVLAKIPSSQDNAAEVEAVAELKRVVDAVRGRHPSIFIGTTGMPILQCDEMQASQSDTLWASLLSLAGVACVFAAGFGGFRRPILAVGVLLIALTWTFGYAALSVGHLNILSVAFGMILIGLGIDFGIHYVAQYSQQLQALGDRQRAIVETARSVGPGIVTGGVTSALAFCTAALTDFTGLAELGVIAAGGIVLCMLAAIVLLPAMIVRWDPTRISRSEARMLPLAPLFSRITGSARRVAVGCVLATGLLGFGLNKLHYDHNLLELQPARSESVELERRLAARANRSVWFALSVASSRQELLARKRSFDALGVVARTEEIATLLRPAVAAKQQLIARIRRRLTGLPVRSPLIPVGQQDEASRVLQALGSGTSNRQILGAAAARLRQMSPVGYFRRVSTFQQHVADELLSVLGAMREMADPAPPSASDLPAPLVQRFVGRRGRHLLRVYGRGEIWDTDSLRQFVRSVEGVDPAITGHPIQTYYAAHQMHRSYLHAAVYSLLAVSIALMIDFRKIRYVLLAILPMALGMLQLFGLLGWLGIPLNPANLIVLPLILGIGIDDGVHVVHDYLRRPGARYQLSNPTAMAVVITSATTMIGFGSMMLATHRGLRSLGQVLTLGIFCCLVSSLVVLPPLLSWLGSAFSADELGDKLGDSTRSNLARQE